MHRISLAVASASLAATAASAGNLDRSGQSVELLFEEGNRVELGWSHSFMSLGGRGVGIGPFPGGTRYDDVGGDFDIVSGGLKFDFSDRVSAALIVENPFGADVDYPGDPGTTELGGTSAFASSTSITGVLRYRFTDNWSAHGGVRIQRARGEIGLSGLSYGAVNGYNVELKESTGFGWLAGVAYERPEIALRIALTYNSAITHDFDTTESGPLIDPDGPGPLPALPLLDGTSKTEVSLPQSVNLDFQTGVAADTLVFGQIRWVEWSAFRVDPELFEAVTGVGLIELEDTITYTIGVGRRFNETWAGSISMVYEDAGDRLVSPLSPTTGLFGIGIGGSYALNENTTLSAGVRYTWLGDAEPETGTPDVARADFSDNNLLTVGFRIAYTF